TGRHSGDGDLEVGAGDAVADGLLADDDVTGDLHDAALTQFAHQLIEVTDLEGRIGAAEQVQVAVGDAVAIGGGTEDTGGVAPLGTEDVEHRRGRHELDVRGRVERLVLVDRE